MWLLVSLSTMMAIASMGCNFFGDSYGELPENVGYLRSESFSTAELIIFDADTFEIYRKVDLPKHLVGDSHRFEIDDYGRIWIGFTGEYTGGPSLSDLLSGRISRDDILIFSADGDLIHEIKDPCAAPEGGIAFANGYAFVGCLHSGFKPRVAVINQLSFEIVKVIDMTLPDFDHSRTFFLTTVGAVNDSILVVGNAHPPEGYEPVDIHGSGVVGVVAVVDPISFQPKGYLELPPGSFIYDVAEIDGYAWLFNTLSHIAEPQPRVDVYVMAPNSVAIADRFNLPKAYPVLSELVNDQLFIYHNSEDLWARSGYEKTRKEITDEIAGPAMGLTSIDLNSGEREYIAANIQSQEVYDRFSQVYDMDIYNGLPCMALNSLEGRGGLYCMDAQGDVEQKLILDRAVGIMFP